MPLEFGHALQALDTVQRLLVRLVEAVAGTMLIIMAVIVFLAVSDRFLLSFGLPWPEELARYMLIWVSMLSAAIAVPKGQHYVVDYFCRTVLPDRRQRLLTSVACPLVSLATVLVLLSSSVELTRRVAFQQAPALELSMSWAYAALPVSFALMALFFLMEIAGALGSRPGERRPEAGPPPTSDPMATT